MQIAMLLIICLSLLSCDDGPNLPKRPDGKSCVHSNGRFGCDEINNPEAPQVIYDSSAPEMQKAQCMPFETFERYSNYVQELKDLADRRCR